MTTDDLGARLFRKSSVIGVSGRRILNAPSSFMAQADKKYMTELFPSGDICACLIFLRSSPFE